MQLVAICTRMLRRVAQGNKTMRTQKIEQFIEGMQWLFGVQNYDRTLKIKDKDEEDTAAEIIFNEKYQRIKIAIYPCFWEHTLKEQRKLLLHELCHTITLPMHHLAVEFLRGEQASTETHFIDTMERSTCQIENILDGLLQNRLKYAKKAYADYIKVKKKKRK